MLRLLGNTIKVVVSCLCGLLGAAVLLAAFSDDDFDIVPFGIGLFFIALAYMPWIIGGKPRVTAVAVGVLGGSIATLFIGIALQGLFGDLLPRNCERRVRRLSCAVDNWLYDLGGSYLLGAMYAAFALAVAVFTIKAVRHVRGG